MSPLALVVWALVAAFGAVGLTVQLRHAPIIRGWVQEAKKPWACNVCMPLYTSALMLVWPIAQNGPEVVLAFPGAYAIAYIVLEKMARPPGPPPLPSEFLEVDEEGT